MVIDEVCYCVLVVGIVVCEIEVCELGGVVLDAIIVACCSVFWYRVEVDLLVVNLCIWVLVVVLDGI